MKLQNQTLRMGTPEQGGWLAQVGSAIAGEFDPTTYPLRLSIAEVRGEVAVVEATVLTLDPAAADRMPPPALLSPRRREHHTDPFAVVHVVPTGICCEFGGFAGDACPATNLLASSADLLITHPNAVNASELNEMAPGVLYVEGKTLDDFLLGHVGLARVPSNRIGTFIDPSGLEFLDHVTNALDAARATGGIDCGSYVVLREPLGVEIEWSDRGCAVGTLANPGTLLEGVAALLADGATAIGGVSVIHGVTQQMYDRHLRGEIPNPSGGVEAILTHLVSSWFRVPAAHAPLPYDRHWKRHTAPDPRASAEFISTPHYFSVLKGLARAPRPVPLGSLRAPLTALITVNHVGAIVMPASCLGGIPALAAEFSSIPVIAVQDNRTILDVTNERMRMANVIEVGSYFEAAGVVLALRKGISLESLRRPLHVSRRIDLAPVPVEPDRATVQAPSPEPV